MMLLVIYYTGEIGCLYIWTLFVIGLEGWGSSINVSVELCVVFEIFSSKNVSKSFIYMQEKLQGSTASDEEESQAMHCFGIPAVFYSPSCETLNITNKGYIDWIGSMKPLKPEGLCLWKKGKL